MPLSSSLSAKGGQASSLPAPFRIRYWGATGSFVRTPRPDDFRERLAAAIEAVSADERWGPFLAGRPDRGAIASFLQQHLPPALQCAYGGNTTCIEIETPDELLILDLGSGAHHWGQSLARRWNAPDYKGPRRAHVLFTHAHMDHIAGAPFVDPFYDPRNHFAFWGPRLVLDRVDAVLGRESWLSQAYFPVTYANMVGIQEFHAVEPGQTFAIGQTEISTYALTHPGGSMAYRLQRGGRRIVLATDHEHPEIPDRGLAEFAAGADLLYVDAQYTTDEYEGRAGIGGGAAQSRKGWGHSTIEAALATALAAGVSRLHLGHHDPSRGDEALFQLEQWAKRMLGEALASAGKPRDACAVELAREGISFTLDSGNGVAMHLPSDTSPKR